MNKPEILSQLNHHLAVALVGDLPQIAHIQMELINHCNFQCPLCLHTLDEAPVLKSLTLNEVKQMIGPIAEQVQEFTLHGTRGEPLLNAQAVAIVDWLKSNTSAKITFSTNGSLLTQAKALSLIQSGLDRIIFVIDGIDQDTYEEYRVGGVLSEVLLNMQNLARLKQENKSSLPKIIFQLMPMSTNEHQLSKVREFALKHGADRVRFRYPKNISQSPSFKPRYEKHHDRLDQATPTQANCPFGLNSLYIDPFGNCFSCGYGESSREGLLGNALKTSVLEVWDHPKLWNIRQSFATSSNHSPMCVRFCSKRMAKNTIGL